jgi:hypothetical protein
MVHGSLLGAKGARGYVSALITKRAGRKTGGIRPIARKWPRRGEMGALILRELLEFVAGVIG